MFSSYFQLYEEEVNALVFKARFPALLRVMFRDFQLKADYLLVLRGNKDYKIVFPDIAIENNKQLLAKFLVQNKIFEFWVYDWKSKEPKKLTILDLA